MAAPTAHIIFLVSLESLMRLNWHFAFLLVGFALAEAGVSIWLLARLNRNAPTIKIDRLREPTESLSAINR